MTAPGDPTRPVTFNRYLYAGGDPVNQFDPAGRQFAELSFCFAFDMAGLAAGLTAALPYFIGILALLAVALLVAGVLPLSQAPAITNSPAAALDAEQEK